MPITLVCDAAATSASTREGRGRRTADVSVALQMVLMLENVECRAI
jgi:hypothetical protein